MSHTCATCRFVRTERGYECCHRYPSAIRVYGGHVCGEHAPRPDEAGLGLPRPWEWDATYAGVTRAIVRGNPRCHIEIMPNGIVSVAGAYVEDVEAVIAAHRARVGGAS